MKTSKGFTLIEILVVISVIAILAASLVPVIGNVIHDARKSGLLDQLKVLSEAVETFKLHTGVYPPSQQLGTDPNLIISTGLSTGTGALWRGPYVKKWPRGHYWSTNVDDWRYRHAGDATNVWPCNLFNFNGTANDTACFIILNIPADVRAYVDNQLDDAASTATDANTTGVVRLYNNWLSVYIGEGPVEP